MMYPRYAADRARMILADTPVLGLIGPRQSGKTTLARQLEPDRRYITLDNPNTLAAALADPVGTIRRLDTVIIDEIQRAPALMLAIKQSVDADRRPGRFLVTGSANIVTARGIQDSMAGRIENLRLLPLSQDELANQGPAHFLDRLFAGDAFAPTGIDHTIVERVLAGGYPEVIARPDGRRRRDWLAAYINVLAERDLPDIATIERAADVPRFFNLLATLGGQLINASAMGARLKIDRKTALRYLGLAEQLFIVRSLPAWSNNALKRLVKAPKLHFIDSGLAAALRGVTPERIATDRTAFGSLLESFVLAELEKQSGWSEGRYAFSHFRDKDGVEVDIIAEDEAGRIVGIEVKASATVTASDFAGLTRLSAAAGEFVAGVVLYDGSEPLSFGDKMQALPLASLWSPMP
jgi:uncharacterized protein